MLYTQDQVQDVLDAMFEKTVDSGDYVIRQGDDGDNFYVIDRYTPIKSCASSHSFISCVFQNYSFDSAVRSTSTSPQTRSQLSGW